MNACRTCDGRSCPCGQNAAHSRLRLDRAHRTIDTWCRLAGFEPTGTPPAVTEHAIERMLEVTA